MLKGKTLPAIPMTTLVSPPDAAPIAPVSTTLQGPPGLPVGEAPATVAGPFKRFVRDFNKLRDKPLQNAVMGMYSQFVNVTTATSRPDVRGHLTVQPTPVGATLPLSQSRVDGLTRKLAN